MDKGTIVKLAQPAATAFLGISIICLPLIVRASDVLSIIGYGDWSEGAAVKVYLINKCTEGMTF